jgi:hypothetical protein
MTKPGYGTQENPLTINDAFRYDLIQPGHTVYIRGGVYPISSLCTIDGTSESRITVRPYNNERVVILGSWNDAQSSYVDYIDLEFAGDHDPFEPYDPTKDHAFAGLGNRIINCTLSGSHNAGAWDNVDLVYGTISFNHGVIDNGIGYGHSLYTQNQDPTHNKVIKHSVFGRSANYGLHGYATDYFLTNIDILENVLLPGHSAHLIGSQKADDGVTFNGNHSCWIVAIGYGAHDHTNLTMEDNYLFNPNGACFQYHRYVTGIIRNNKFVITYPTQQDIIVTHQPEQSASVLDFDNNLYYNPTGKTRCFGDDQAQPLPWKSLEEWRDAYGFDLHSTIYLDGTLPADSVHVYGNEYAGISKRKALIVIHNWSEASSVDVDLSDIAIDPGQTFQLLQAQDPLNDVVTGTMPADHILTIDMTGHSIAGVTGWADPPSTFPTFGAFIVEAA